MKRDPRVAPVAGDVIETPGICRTVDSARRGFGVQFTQSDFAGIHTCCRVTLSSWRKWAKKAEVIYHAD